MAAYDDEVTEWLIDEGQKAKSTTSSPQRSPQAAQQTGQLVVTKLADVVEHSVEWLWPQYLPLGKLAILEGPPGQGKSTLTIEIAARITTGREMPDGAKSGTSGKGHVLFLSYEDDAADTIKPRLLAAGGDPSLVYMLEGVQTAADEHARSVRLVADRDRIERLVEEHPDARLLVVDPLSAALGHETDMHKDQDVRNALAPIAKLAERTGLCVLLVRHHRKSASGSALYAGGGSVGIIASARQALYLDQHPEDDSRLVLAVAKSNLVRHAPSLCFRKETASVDGTNGRRLQTSRLIFEGPVPLTADALLRARSDQTAASQSVAETFLRQLLSQGAKERQEVLKAAEAAGIPERTLERTASRLGIERKQQGYGKDRKAVWANPAISANPATPENVAEMADMGLEGARDVDAA